MWRAGTRTAPPSWLLAVVLAIALLLVIFAEASEAAPRAPRYEVQQANTSGLVTLRERHGYSIGLYMPSAGVAMFFVDKFEQGDNTFTDAHSEYVVHNRSSLARGVIRARLGSLGRVSLRFRPNGHVRKHKTPFCRGPAPFTEYGTFVGGVRFDGENDYLHVSFSRGKGEITRSFRLRCKKGWASDLSPESLREYAAPGLSFDFSPGRGTISLLYAAARDHGRSIGIRAAHQEGSPSGAEVQLGTVESRGGMAIGRAAFLEGVPGTLLTSLPGVHPATATLAPPAPFFGEANYLENSATSHSWTGTLGVELPGLTLPLAGPGFYTSLCVVSPLKTPDGCDFIKQKPLRPERRSARPGWMLR